MHFKIMVITLCCSYGIPINAIGASERKALNELRPLVQTALYLPYMRTDSFLLRWLEDRNYGVEAAKTKLLKAIHWRKVNKIDDIILLNESDALVDQYVKHDITVRDALGNPVVTADVGNWDIRRIVLAGKLDASIRLGLIKMMEAAGSLSAEIQKTKPEANQWNMCGNLQGYNLRKHGCLACIPFYLGFVTNYENYYTGSARSLILINAPRVFGAMAGIIRAAMSPGTKRAFRIYGNDKSEWDFLDTIIPRSQLPLRYGGSLSNY